MTTVSNWWGNIQSKENVFLCVLQPEIRMAIKVFYNLYLDIGLPLVVTSTNEGAHSTGSLHYSGNACDIRTRDIDIETLQELVKEAKFQLGEDYDVVLEPNHIHLEYDPKVRSVSLQC